MEQKFTCLKEFSQTYQYTNIKTNTWNKSLMKNREKIDNEANILFNIHFNS